MFTCSLLNSCQVIRPFFNKKHNTQKYINDSNNLYKLNKLGNEVRHEGRIFGLSCAQVMLCEGMPFTGQEAFAVGNSEAAHNTFLCI